MKYLKTYEKVNKLGYETDENKVYVYLIQGAVIDYYIIGKFHDNGYVIKGYDLEDYIKSKNIEEAHSFVTTNSFKFVREATPEETGMFQLMDNQIKFNI